MGDPNPTLARPVPCTACRRCTDGGIAGAPSGCPAGLNIPALLALYNRICAEGKKEYLPRLAALPAVAQPAACVACCYCARVCPEGIFVPDALAMLAEAGKDA